MKLYFLAKAFFFPFFSLKDKVHTPRNFQMLPSLLKVGRYRQTASLDLKLSDIPYIINKPP